MERALVSVIIPSYKRADTLKRAIDSVLNQTYTNIELLVVDDNIPGDKYSLGLKKMIEKYDGKVKLVTQKEHINGAVARNEGVNCSNGEYIAFLDDDDEWHPDKIEKQVDIIESDTEIGGVAGGVTLWRNGEEITRLPKNRITEKDLLFKVLIREVGLATSSFLCKKSAFNEIGGFDVNLRRSQDLQLFTDFLSRFRIYPIWDFRTTKMHVESSINRLDAKSLAVNKEDFFKSVNKVIQGFPERTQRRIKSAHYYEIAFVAIREKNFFFALKYVLKGLRSLASLSDLYKRYKSR